MSDFSFKLLGSFDVPSGRLVVADVVYLSHNHLAVVIGNAKRGRWIALAEIGPGVGSLFVFHEADAVSDAEDDRELRFSVGVDSGRVCICDSESVERYGGANLNPGFVADPLGVMVPSGCGDGIYDCRVREHGGEAVSVRVRFIESGVIQ